MTTEAQVAAGVCQVMRNKANLGCLRTTIGKLRLPLPPKRVRGILRNKANGGPGAGDCGLNSRSKRIKQTHFRGAGGGRAPQEQLCKTKPILRDMGKACLRERRHGTQFTESRSCETKPIGWELDER